MSSKNLVLHPFLKTSIGLVGVYLFFYILFIGQYIIIPLILASLLAAGLIATKNFFDRKLNVPHVISVGLSGLLWLLVLYILGIIINSNVQTIISEASHYEEKIVLILQQFSDILGIEQKVSFVDILQKINIPGLISSVGSALTALAGSTGTILMYTAFILAEQHFVHKKMQTLLSFSDESKKFSKVLQKVFGDIRAYFVIHSSFSFATGFGTFLICWAFGLEFAAFWGLLAFLLNFIPTIGSLLAAGIPILFSLVQYGADGMWIYVTLIASLLFTLQFVVGNVIEPKFLGNKLGLSPLIILLSLTFWGTLWGVTGMFLSIPLMVMLNIICSHFPETKWLHVILSASGEVKK